MAIPTTSQNMFLAGGGVNYLQDLVQEVQSGPQWRGPVERRALELPEALPDAEVQNGSRQSHAFG